jgi:hypothetical protein
LRKRKEVLLATEDPLDLGWLVILLTIMEVVTTGSDRLITLTDTPWEDLVAAGDHPITLSIGVQGKGADAGGEDPLPTWLSV